jgi:AcrR family transcriptional regulator
MPYAPDHKAETRRRILESARRLFNRNGFSDVTIEQVMKRVGLTRGGFYKHFESKEALYAAAIRQFAASPAPEPWQTRHIDPNAEGPDLARMIVSAYLSPDHLADLDGSCPMIGLPSDTARGGQLVKAAYREVLDMMVAVFTANLREDDCPARERALTLAATCVGAMVLARAVDDRGLANELREAAHRRILADTGWTPP